jgi:methionine-rich copper-binding protein CopC
MIRVQLHQKARYIMRSHRWRSISILATALVLGGATIALGHTEVASTSPASGATAKTSIKQVTVTFTGPLRRGTLRVVGPGGKVVSAGGGRDPRNVKRLLAGLKGTLKPGSYKAGWTIVAPDGHGQKGSFRFKLKR